MKNIIVLFVMLLQTVSSVEWHRKGDYFSTVMPADILFPVLLITYYYFLYDMLEQLFYLSIESLLICSSSHVKIRDS